MGFLDTIEKTFLFSPVVTGPMVIDQEGLIGFSILSAPLLKTAPHSELSPSDSLCRGEGAITSSPLLSHSINTSFMRI